MAGTKVAPYEVLYLISKDGMSEVYKATNGAAFLASLPF
jgi:hypothetical protein